MSGVVLGQRRAQVRVALEQLLQLACGQLQDHAIRVWRCQSYAFDETLPQLGIVPHLLCVLCMCTILVSKTTTVR